MNFRIRNRTARIICLLILSASLCGACYALEPAEEAFQKGITYSKNQNYEEAITELTKSILINPSSRVYSFRAYVYLMQNNAEKALADCDKALEIDPKNAQAYNNRAAAYQKKDNFDKAIEDCGKAIEIDANNPYFYKNRALAYFSKKEYESSWKDAHKAESFGFKLNAEFIEALKSASGKTN
ncbi:MAG: tetratricopeptide repeat protein [Candidatus Omnitrophica bacterium]|nr:tetratricopeptide repeat protein [Candidatus Omnitrophota bacterium]